MSETSLGSENPLWYIVKSNDPIVSLLRIIEKYFLNLQPKQHVLDVFHDFEGTGRLPTLVKIVGYAVRKYRGLEAH